MGEFSADLVGRIAARAGDPLRRTYMAATRATAQPLDFGALMADLSRHGAPGAQVLGGALGKLQGLMGSMPGMTMMGPGGAMSFGGVVGADPAGPQPSAAPAAIGRAFPPELKQLYAIADGGFGPGEGLFSLDELVRRYRDLSDEPYGPLGQDWPKNLLPLFDEDPVLNCLDLDSGGTVAWDPEEIEDEEDDADWLRSFKPEHASLAELMESWLGRRTFDEEHR